MRNCKFCSKQKMFLVTHRQTDTTHIQYMCTPPPPQKNTHTTCTCSLAKLVTWVSPGERFKRNLGKMTQLAIELPKRPTPPEIPKLWVDLEMIPLMGSPHLSQWLGEDRWRKKKKE